MPFSSRFLRVSWSALDVRWGAALISLALSAWALARDPVINNDGILYLRTAALFDQGDWRGALALYPWPLYSWLVFFAGRLSGLGLEYSAHLLDALLTGAAAYFFIALVKQLGGNDKVLVAAALIVLLHPRMNDYRTFIGRDPGYWAFYLAAMLMFIRYFQRPDWKHAAGWGTSMALATLFRIEGAVILLLLPFALLLREETSLTARLRLIVGAHAVTLLVAGGFVAWGLISHPDPASLHTGRLAELIDRLQNFGHQLAGGLQDKAALLNQSVLNKWSAEHAMSALITALLVILVSEIVAVASPLYIFLAFHAWYRAHFQPPRGAKVILTWSMLLNVLILTVFLVTQFFLSGRFVMALALTLMLLAPFSLVAVYDKWQARRFLPFRKNWLFPALCAVFSVSAVHSLYSFGPSKDHIKQAGIWIKNNTPQDARLYSDSPIVPFYAAKSATDWSRAFNREEARRIIEEGSWRSYQYLAVNVKRKHPEEASRLIEKLGREPIARFNNSRGDEILVFKTF
jgi:4-amino-4-deoxy-L-arabinose transferase-like glycosyltransferase